MYWAIGITAVLAILGVVFLVARHPRPRRNRDRRVISVQLLPEHLADEFFKSGSNPGFLIGREGHVCYVPVPPITKRRYRANSNLRGRAAAQKGGHESKGH